MSKPPKILDLYGYTEIRSPSGEVNGGWSSKEIAGAVPQRYHHSRAVIALREALELIARDRDGTKSSIIAQTALALFDMPDPPEPKPVGEARRVWERHKLAKHPVNPNVRILLQTISACFA